jgi:hypothetical protein
MYLPLPTCALLFFFLKLATGNKAEKKKGRQ